MVGHFYGLRGNLGALKKRKRVKVFAFHFGLSDRAGVQNASGSSKVQHTMIICTHRGLQITLSHAVDCFVES